MAAIDDVESAARSEVLGHRLSDEVAATLTSIAVSGRQIDLLIGPAGAGKTTAMRALHQAWTRTHGSGSVVGLAPSAAAAEVLAQDLGVACDNTAKWLHGHGRTSFRRGQLVIVDEATLAGTLTLDRLTGLAAEAGAKVLLVGDWAQLQSVDAGGALPLLVEARDDTPELTEVHRFTHDWEKDASLDLRQGRTKAISVYARHHRIRDGAHADMLDAAYLAWRADLREGHSSVLVTESTEAMIELNERARAERLHDGETLPTREVALHDGTRASVGDLVLTRRNHRDLVVDGSGWVKNGDRWRVTDVLDEGTLIARRLGGTTSGAVMLPPDYVAEHVDLAYAVTAHRAQGLTVDTAHVVVTSATTRENLYVAMTRGRESNTAYVALDQPDDSHATPTPGDATAGTVLYGVLAHSGIELSAHQTLIQEHERWSGFDRLVAEYLTIAAEAQRDRWITELLTAGLSTDQVEAVLDSASFGPLAAELRRAEASGHDLPRTLRKVITQRRLDDVNDIGAVLISRLRHRCTRAQERKRRGRLIAGLVVPADGPMPDDMSRALKEREDLMEARATSLAQAAVAEKEPWLRCCGPPPADPRQRHAWLQEVRTVAVYRDLWNVDHEVPVGDGGVSDRQRAHAVRARRAAHRAEVIAAGVSGRPEAVHLRDWAALI